MSVSTQIVLLRKEHNITQKELASGCNLTEISIQNYESGRRKPSYEALLALADFFDVSIDYLVGRTDKREINR